MGQRVPAEWGSPCAFHCGFYSLLNSELLDHEDAEHRTCTDCGHEPNGDYPVSHAADCPRLAPEGGAA